MGGCVEKMWIYCILTVETTGSPSTPSSVVLSEHLAAKVATLQMGSNSADPLMKHYPQETTPTTGGQQRRDLRHMYVVIVRDRKTQ